MICCKKLLKYFSVALIFLFVHPLYPQNENQSYIQNLINQAETKEGSRKLPLLREIVRYYINNSPVEGEKWVEEAIGISLKEKLFNSAGGFYLDYSHIKFIQSYYSEAEEHALTALEYKLKDTDSSGIAECFNQLSYLNTFMGNYEKSFSFAVKAQKLAELIKDDINLSDAYNRIGILHYLLKDKAKARTYLLKALDLSRASGNKMGQAAAYIHFTILAISESNFQKAIENGKKALALYKEIGFKRGIAGALENISIAYRIVPDYNKALEYSVQALAIKREINDRQGISASLSNTGITHWRLKNYNKCLEYFKETYNLRLELKDIRGLSAVTSYLSQVYEETGDITSAYKFLKVHNSYTDSLFNETKTKQIREINAKHENEKRESELSALQTENALNRKLTHYYILILISAAIVLFLLVIAYIQKKRNNEKLKAVNDKIRIQKEELEKLNTQLSASHAEKDKLFGIVAHDLKSPFQIVMGFGELLSLTSSELTKEEVVEYSKNIYSASRRIYDLLENLLNWALIKMGKLNIKSSSFLFSEEIEKILNLYSQNIEAKKLNIEKDYPVTQMLNADQFSLSVVFRNLISNAVKFTPTGGTIKIKSGTTGSFHSISIIDSGVGIDPEILENLFSAFSGSSVGTEGERGTGLGLIVCKEIIELHHGTMEVFSTKGAGTEFKIQIPQ